MTKKSIVFKKSEFDFILDYERCRTDVSKISFSLISLSPSSNLKNSKNMEKFLKSVHRKLRNLDVIGFIENSKFYILLPATTFQESRLFINKLQNMIKEYSNLIQSQEIYTYPENWPETEKLFK